MKNFALFLVVTVMLVNNAGACTTFNLCQGDDVNLFAKNYDWHIGDGAVIINKRGLKKTAMKIKEDPGIPVEWVSTYGSITFNQYGRELPTGGMNEAGLVVELMAVPEAEFPPTDDRPYISMRQFRQYLLDNFRTVQEFIESDSRVRVAKGTGIGVHMLIGDRTGESAVVEFIGGKRVVYTGKSLPVRALSNTSYAESLTHWRAKKLPPEDPWRSVERFILAADSASSFDPKAVKAPVDHAFGILKKVAQGDHTKWSIVYDIKDLQVFFHTSANPKERVIDLKAVDFSCRTPVKIIDIDAGSGSILNSFQSYTMQANRKLISEAFGKTDFLKNVPAQTIDAIAAYPESMKCEQ
ncbi:MAG: linear amide C-N hydrolase [Desulfuromonadales bacterium]|nr:linear amide C-N hydrolase [Desulfuromonadales bacterium]